MPVIGSNQEIIKEYLGPDEIGTIFLGNTLVQGVEEPGTIPLQSDLIFNVDANDINSYPGSGSTWFNTATNGASTNLLFTGSVSFNTGEFNKTNYFQFDTASYWSTSNIAATVNNRTLCAWIWADDTSNNEWLNYGRGTGATDLGNSRLQTNSNVATFAASNFAPQPTGSVSSGAWFNLIGVGIEGGINDTASLYINGVLAETVTGEILSQRQNRAVWAPNLQGRIALMSIYDVAFDAATALNYFKNTRVLFT
jgi:hypothetical protein